MRRLTVHSCRLAALLAMSASLAASDSDGVHQYFITEPQDVTANLGDTVVFPCVVGRRDGMLQWTRNGFGLGMEASLPGFPRYSLTPADGLRIEPVTEADAGEYQCQVGAGPASPPIRSRSARLAVQVPPGPPHILQSLDSEDDGIVRVKDGEIAILECQSDGGRPAASLEWWQDERGQTPLHLEAVNTRTVKDDATDSFRTVSSLRFRVCRADHHSRLILCSASNVAAASGSSPKLVTQVRLEVLSAPRVELGISSGVGPLREDTPGGVVLHCQADSYPPVTAFTWYRDGRLLAGETREFLNIHRLDRNLHNAVIGCEASNTMGSSPRAVKSLSLQYGPAIVQQPEAMLVGREGETIQLTCKADSNPPARYTWTKETAAAESAGGGDSHLQSTPVGYSSSLQLVVSRHTVGVYRCQALVEGWDSAWSRSALVGILERPRIETSPAGGGGQAVQYAAVGEDVELTCRIQSLSRDLNVTWDYKGEQRLFNFPY
jgi:hypothetical protein